MRARFSARYRAPQRCLARGRRVDFGLMTASPCVNGPSSGPRRLENTRFLSSRAHAIQARAAAFARAAIGLDTRFGLGYQVGSRQPPAVAREARNEVLWQAA